MRYLYKIVLTVVLSVSCLFLFGQQTKTPKYIFLFIGDGMGLAHTALAEYYMKSTGKPNYVLAMNRLPVYGMLTTHSQSHTITCSAAAGTALACGHKTTKGTIAMDSAHVVKYSSVAVRAQELGKRVGIITSVSIDHATPSVFYAHQGARNDYYNIAAQLPSSQFDFFAGGAFLDPNGLKKKGYDQQSPINAYELAEKNGYRCVKSKADFMALKQGERKILAIDTALWHSIDISYTIDRAKKDLSLFDVTKKAIEVLDNEQGFFIMVEGGKIDWAAHNNDAATAIHEVYDFDAAIASAQEFAKLHPDETLILVTSDHETGGLGLGNFENQYDSHYALFSNQKYSSLEITARMKRLRKASAKFEQVLDSLEQWLGLGKTILLSDAEIDSIKKQYTAYWANNAAIASTYEDLDPVTAISLQILARKAGVGWTTTAHTACPIPIRAGGQGQELFGGYQDNTSVANHLFQLLGR